MLNSSLYLFVTLLIFPLTMADLSWFPLTRTLPLPLSDMTATTLPFINGTSLGGNIIITGGCSDEDGNSAFFDGNSTNYYCGELTDKTFMFNPFSETISPLADMLIPRYRHASAIVNDKLYVVGGRDLDDNIIAQVDYYDPLLNTWATLLNLPERFLTSDNAAVEYDNQLYVIGGYDEDYNTHNTTLAIDVLTRKFVEKADMLIARGDAPAITYTFVNDTTKAYIMGGFSHANEWCAPLHEGEVYDFEMDEWTSIDSLGEKRGDKAVVMLGDVIWAIGGETKHEDVCKGDEDVVPSSVAETVSSIEFYSVTEESPKWRKGLDVPFHRFRAAAASVESTKTVFVFGGQESYDDDCQCYKTSNLIHTVRDVNSSSGQKHVSTWLMCLLVCIVTLYVI